MAKQTYVYVDWRKIETVREALDAKSINTLCDLSGRDPRHRKTLLALTPSERARLVRLDDKLASEVAIAAAFLCDEKKLADGLGLFDLVASSGHAVACVDMSAGVNATYYLLTAGAGLQTRERARKYVDYFGPIAPNNTPILLNLALVERDVLKDGKSAILNLRKAIELGDPRIRAQIDEEADEWRSLPGFAALASVTPTIPVGLRCLQTWNDLRGDAVEPLYDAGLAYFDLGFEQKLSKTFDGVDDASFEVFARSEEGDSWALWRRDAKAPRELSPVVVFGGQRSVGVYADSVAAMMCLFANGWKASDVEAIGYRYGDDGWPAPKHLRKLKPRKSMLKQLAEVMPEAMKLDPEKARQKALALMPAFITEATSRSKKSGARSPGTTATSAKAKKKPSPQQHAPLDVGFAKVPETEWPADLVFLQSKSGKTWLRTLDVRLLRSKGKPPQLIEDLNRADDADNDPETRANQRAIREVLGMITFAIEAPEDNAKLYGYWRGPEKTPLERAPIVSFDSEGTISRAVGASLIEVLLQESCYEEPELFAERKAKLEEAGLTIRTKRWNDYAARAKWVSDPEKLHNKLYEKYRKAPG